MLSLKLSAPIIGLFSAGLLALGLYGMTIESAPFLRTAGTVADRLAAVEIDPGVPFLSSKRALVVFNDDCRWLAYGQTADAIAAEDRRRLNRACLERSRSLVAAAPANARLWLTFGWFAAQHADQHALAFHAIERSRAFGSWQFALASERTALIAALPDAPPAIKAIADADIDTLAASDRGRVALAETYIAAPDHRGLITAAIEKRPQAEQRQFLSVIRRAVQ